MVNHPNRKKRATAPSEDLKDQVDVVSFPIGRAIATLVLIFAYAWINYLLNPVATLGAGKMAGGQFENSDTAYVVSRFGMDFFSHVGVPLIVLLVVLVVLWWKPVKQYLALATTLALLLTVLVPSPAYSYYQKDNYAEPYFVLPNESAFYIPDVGANKDSQASFGSEAYLTANKIAAKRFEIPHVKLENSGFFSNFWVPAGRLITVDRTPVTREWVTSDGRGTSKHNEGFPCQSVEGLNMTAGIAIGTSVLEENSPRFLYRFGVNPPDGDRTKPEVVFTSVYSGKSLAQVMDGVVRKKVQSLVCEEFTKRKFDVANAELPQMMAGITTKVDVYLKGVGITLDFIGWADTINFDEHVQKSINDRYVAEKIAPVMQTLTQNADNAVKEGLGKGLATKGLPANLVAIPERLLDLSQMFGAGKK